ncbi:MAG: hypothetical protein K6V97_14450 [Actinomycetia bacterium]|nr:hypothetical protein [Actinomycetes bacterium]
MEAKAVAFFSDCAVELPTPIFVASEARRRGRRPAHELYFPNGQRRPTREELLRFILTHVLYQIDPATDGPVFCKHIQRHNPERNKVSLFHIVMGPHEVTGVWEIIGSRRMFDLRAVYLPRQQTWVPQLVLAPGNYVGVGRLNGLELSPRELRSEMIRRGFVTAEELDRFAAATRARRERAIAYAWRGIWM